ncbi:hypothetical protein ACLOJK_016268 [Asimina triloba]
MGHTWCVEREKTGVEDAHARHMAPKGVVVIFLASVEGWGPRKSDCKAVEPTRVRQWRARVNNTDPNCRGNITNSVRLSPSPDI